MPLQDFSGYDDQGYSNYGYGSDVALGGGWPAGAELGGYTGGNMGASPEGGPSNQGLPPAGDDPFGYTNGSLLNPFGQQFNYNGPGPGGGGYSLKAYDPGKFNYTPYADAKQIDAYKQFNYDPLQTPDKLQARPDFKFTGEDLASDPSYAFRKSQGEQSLKNMRSASGLLNTGATGKALLDYGQNAASQEYGAAYNRAFGTDQAMRQSDLNNYGLNAQTQMAAQGQQYNQAANANNQNFQNQMSQGATNEGMRLAANQNQFQQNATNYGLNKDVYDTQYGYEAQQAAANASASASANNQSYNRALGEYQMNRGFYNEDQDRQFGKLMSLANLGFGATNNDVSQGAAAAGNIGNLNTQIGNAQGAGRIGAANGWSNGMTGIGSAADQALGAYGSFKGYW